MGMSNEKWLTLDVKVATPSEKVPIIESKMGLCFCGEPCVSVDDGPYTHAISMQVECADDPRNDPPQ